MHNDGGATIPKLNCVGHDCVVPHSDIEIAIGIRHGAAVPYKFETEELVI